MSGKLRENAEKSNIYFWGIDKSIQQFILNETGFPLGTFHFRYLCLPMSTKRVSHAICQNLMHKIKEQIGSLGCKNAISCKNGGSYQSNNQRYC